MKTKDQLTTASLDRAVTKALNRVRRNGYTASEVSAGMAEMEGDRGLQVFARVCRFSSQLLDKEPTTGGLLCNVKLDDTRRANAEAMFTELVAELVPKGHKWTPSQKARFNRVASYLEKP